MGSDEKKRSAEDELGIKRARLLSKVAQGVCEATGLPYALVVVGDAFGDSMYVGGNVSSAEMGILLLRQAADSFREESSVVEDHTPKRNPS